jgi:hypothetical protein
MSSQPQPPNLGRVTPMCQEDLTEQALGRLQALCQALPELTERLHSLQDDAERRKKGAKIEKRFKELEEEAEVSLSFSEDRTLRIRLQRIQLVFRDFEEEVGLVDPNEREEPILTAKQKSIFLVLICIVAGIAAGFIIAAGIGGANRLGHQGNARDNWYFLIGMFAAPSILFVPINSALLLCCGPRKIVQLFLILSMLPGCFFGGACLGYGSIQFVEVTIRSFLVWMASYGVLVASGILSFASSFKSRDREKSLLLIAGCVVVMCNCLILIVEAACMFFFFGHQFKVLAYLPLMVAIPSLGMGLGRYIQLRQALNGTIISYPKFPFDAVIAFLSGCLLFGLFIYASHALHFWAAFPPILYFLNAAAFFLLSRQ